MLVTVLLQSACKNDDDNFSGKDFVNALKGEWYVHMFWRYPTYPFPPEIHTIQYGIINDSIDSRYADTAAIYSINDPILCTLPEIENMQKWTITGNNDELTLSTIDLCGITKSYKIEYSNYIYSEDEDGYDIFADVNIISTDTTWQFIILPKIQTTG